ncbi:nuclear transport factor 2 family protein [Croceicoccus estronivorus]|uniref:nuclear transport factor 2 family protein n=1 Tax=Croceicoccus estronivorus TaxID=1172626 RepID=UPI000A8256C4|nr:nuclear transport factor 2 family protein [Croceicoccus estronivorus]
MEDLIRSYYAAYNSVDSDRLSQLLDPQVELVSAMGTQFGRDAYLATYQFMTDQFIDVMEPQEIAVEGNSATVKIRDSLTAKADIADFLGQPIPKGQEMVLNLTGHYTAENGKIVRIEIVPQA